MKTKRLRRSDVRIGETYTTQRGRTVYRVRVLRFVSDHPGWGKSEGGLVEVEVLPTGSMPRTWFVACKTLQPITFEIAEIKRGTVTVNATSSTAPNAFVPTAVDLDFTTAQISEPIAVPLCDDCGLPLVIGIVKDVLGISCQCRRRRP